MNSPVTVRQLFDRYASDRLQSRATIGTVRRYEFVLRRFDRFLGREALVADLNESNVTALLEQTRAIVVNTCRVKLVNLRNFARQSGWLTH